MEMLRNWNGDSLTSVRDVLTFFGLESHGLELLKYEVLSPDSFIWVLNSNNIRYCLYAEDFVTSINHVAEAMNQYGTLEGETDKYELLQIKNPEEFATSSPVVSAYIYTPPTETKKFMNYAAPFGYDFVFLGKSTIG